MQITKSILKKAYPRRRDWSHKGDSGHLLIVGGSERYTGAPAFNALGALRTGCDLVTIAAPERAADAAAKLAPDIIAQPLDGTHVRKGHLSQLVALLGHANAVVIGCGLGVQTLAPETVQAVAAFLMKVKVPVIVDADAVRVVAEQRRLIKKSFILTPHSGEFALLAGQQPSTKINERAALVEQAAAELGCVILLKGHVDVISDGARTATNRTGNAYMAKGGTGDILAGVCGSLVAQGVAPFTAACAAAYINGKAGDIAARVKKQSLLASDVVEALPKAIS